MKKILLLLFAVVGCLQLKSQCNLVTIKGDELANDDVSIKILSNKGGQPYLIYGEDDDGPHKIYCQVTSTGLVLPMTTGNQINIMNNVDGHGSYSIRIGAQEEDRFMNNYKINPTGQITRWELLDADDEELEDMESNNTSIKNSFYEYDLRGNVNRIKWEGEFQDTHVSDKGELTATYDITKPDVFFKLGTIRFLVEMNWITFPMTNNNLLTSYTYTQTIHLPESKTVIGQEKDGSDIIKIIPEKNITNNITKKFAYRYDGTGRVIGITVTGDGEPTSFKITYGTAKCEK